MNNKALGRYTVNQVEEIEGIVHEHYGSRKSKASDVQAINNFLLYNLVRQKKFTSTSVFAGIISNYELVVQSIDYIALQRVDVPKEPIHFIFITIQNIAHSVRTAFGESANIYRGGIWAIPLKPPPQGLGQVNGAAPKMWAIVRSPLLNFLGEAGHGAVFKCRISRDYLHLVWYCFVDDSTIIQVAPTPDTPLTDTVKLAQNGLNIFAGASKATGVQVSAFLKKIYNGLQMGPRK